jgi:hypothetical protein
MPMAVGVHGFRHPPRSPSRRSPPCPSYAGSPRRTDITPPGGVPGRIQTIPYGHRLVSWRLQEVG